jgi:hypothetical protein
MRGRWTASLCAAFGIWAAGAPAQDVGPRSAAEPPLVELARPVAAGAPAPDAPIATLGRPVAAGRATAAGYGEPIIRAQAPADGPPAVPPPGVPAVPGVPAIPGGPDPIYGAPVGPPPVVPGAPLAPGPAPAGNFWGRCGEVFGFGTPSAGRTLFQSDHAFDNFISPVTNPFEFEDPRSLTEVRPIFMYQNIPHHNPWAGGGSVDFFGVQARLALTDYFSIVMQKFGWVHIEPDQHSPFEDVTGFSEIEIGPKFTFYRCEQSGTVAAAGLTFDIPTGPDRVFQGTGNLGLRPYLSFAQAFGRSSYGSFNFMSSLGYNFGVDNKRSENFYSSYHLDYDVGNAHKIYPLIELNWRHYTRNGKENDFDFEGGDLFNLGSEHVAGENELSLAPGIRYKFCEWAQVGTAFEFPLIRDKDLEAFRWTVDFIFRY